MKKIKKDWINKKDISKETLEYGDYLNDRIITECIAVGDIARLNRAFNNTRFNEKLFKNSLEELRRTKNLFICTTTLAANAAIYSGVPGELAYYIRGIYIEQIEMLTSIDEIKKYLKEMILDFAERVNSIRNKNEYSFHVAQCFNYISTHLYTKISVAEIAEYLGISTEHLCRIFKKETQQSLKTYINLRKIQEAKFLLKHSRYSLSEISFKLSFCSQSYFNSTFKNITGLTPKEYRQTS